MNRRSTLDLFAQSQGQINITLRLDPETGEFVEVQPTTTAQATGAPVVPRGEGSKFLDNPGGEIALSPKVTKKMSESDIASWVRQKGITLLNRMFRSTLVDQSVTDVMQATNTKEVGFTISATGRGKYVPETGEPSKEPSFLVTVKGVPYEVLAALGRDLGERFQQQSVLITDYGTGRSEMMNI